MEPAADPTKTDLAELASRARGGDQTAFRAWLEATHATVYRVALRMLSDPRGAEDVTQEAYIRAWQNMARLKESKASLGWVCRIARNVATDRIRRPAWRRELTVAGDDGTSPLARAESHEPGPEVAASSREERTRVRAAIADLKEKHRVVLLLREVDGMSYEEIAAAMGIPRGTVESRIHRARAQVKKTIERAARREAGSST